jgi:hypothetical protein
MKGERHNEKEKFECLDSDWFCAFSCPCKFDSSKRFWGIL